MTLYRITKITRNVLRKILARAARFHRASKGCVRRYFEWKKPRSRLLDVLCGAGMENGPARKRQYRRPSSTLHIRQDYALEPKTFLEQSGFVNPVLTSVARLVGLQRPRGGFA